MFIRILLRYDLDGNAPNELAQETILALRKTLPHICRPTPQPQQRQIQASSATYTIVHSNAGSSTH